MTPSASIRVVTARRLPRWPMPVVLGVVAWAAAMGAIAALSQWLGQPIVTCPFKRMTGLPCPTCGASRGMLALLHGDVLAAWLCNPLVFTAGAVAVFALALRAATGRSVHLKLSRRARWLAWAVLAVAVAANWAYLIAVGT